MKNYKCAACGMPVGEDDTVWLKDEPYHVGCMPNQYEEAQPGSVSHGTMREKDLIPCFMDLLVRLGHKDDRVREIEEATEAHVEWEDDMGTGHEYYETDTSSYDLEWLFDALDEHAPEGYYFGAHPGDGSDYGFWEEELL